MRERITILLLIAAIVALPLVLRPQRGNLSGEAQDHLVIVSPHTQAIREEFTRAFRAYWKEQTGRDVALDWRMPGGTNDIVRYLDAQYANAFRNYWVNTLHRSWTDAIENGFARGGSGALAEVAEARREFLNGTVGIGVDLFFGGGAYDFSQQNTKGQLVPSGVEARHPGWFTDEILPSQFAGETLRDSKGCWQGTALTSFGLIFNRDRITAAGFEGGPRAWSDLADPRFAGAVALADPVQSGSMAKAFEMILQQQMQQRLRALLAEGVDPAEAQARALAEGWLAGMKIIQLASANSAYYTDSATKPVLDVAAGNCALGMAIDFYGRMEEETLTLRNPGNGARADRFAYITPHGGSSLSPDCIGLLRGAPHREVAEAFIDFVLSPAGQKLWDFRPGTLGGPMRFALRHAPIRRDLYTAEWRPFMADPDMRPYDEAGDFVYQPAWTSPVFGEMRFVIKAAFIDAHQELAAAWEAIQRARQAGRASAAEAALAKLQDLSSVDYAASRTSLKQEFGGGFSSRLRLETALNEQFRRQYREAQALAE